MGTTTGEAELLQGECGITGPPQKEHQGKGATLLIIYLKSEASLYQGEQVAAENSYPGNGEYLEGIGKEECTVTGELTLHGDPTSTDQGLIDFHQGGDYPLCTACCTILCSTRVQA